jgi:hypothetical protein
MVPEPVENWPDDPVMETNVRSALDRDEALDPLFPIDDSIFGVWGITREKTKRTVVSRDEVSGDAVVDIVLETPAEYRMYSYTHHDGTTQWVEYDSETKGTEGGHRLETTLSHYALLAGESDL